MTSQLLLQRQTNLARCLLFCMAGHLGLALRNAHSQTQDHHNWQSARLNYSA
jgi:hypothetical protein